MTMQWKEQIEQIKASRLFDEEWYLAQYPDVAQLGMCPVTHFVRYGWWVGRNPSPAFDTQQYLQQYEDVARSGKNPLLHYLQVGQHEGRAISPVANPIRRNRRSPQPASHSVPEPPPLPAMPPHTETEDPLERLSLQLQETQQLLEHYFNRCQALESQLHQA